MTYKHTWRKHWQAVVLPDDNSDRIDALIAYRTQYKLWLRYHAEKGNTEHVADLRANLDDIREALIVALEREQGAG